MGIRARMRVSCFFLAAFALASAATNQETPSNILTIDPDWLQRNVNTSTHYEDPNPNGCLSDEISIQIQGVSGDVCTPRCTDNSCPQDVPAGVTATPNCALQDSSGNKYCALICSPSGNDSCGA